MQRLLPHLRPEDTVLDIGAGTGRYVPILARTVSRVIAVEPSPAMHVQLEQCIAAEKLDNVEVMATAWPPTSIPRTDVVLSAHVVYSIREIGPFLQAMDAAARRACYLFLMTRHINELFSPFWEQFHGQARLLLPTALETLNVLYQLGFSANLELLPANQQMTFIDADEALDDIRRRLWVAPHPERDTALRAAIDELLVYNADGSLTFPGTGRTSALLWWDATNACNM
jgi:SAM-dependent methyltransferase